MQPEHRLRSGFPGQSQAETSRDRFGVKISGARILRKSGKLKLRSMVPEREYYENQEN